MLFYAPDWDDSVDANYDFNNNQHSALQQTDRDPAFIWNLFPPDALPIDGVVFSREHLTDTPGTLDRLRTNGVYTDPHLDLPEWLPTIGTCGAFNYRNLPFPPHDPQEILEFYGDLNVTTGTAIDHLVMGSDPDSTRLYLDQSAFTNTFTPSDLPEKLHNHADIMIDDWPNTWSDIVRPYEPSICTSESTDAFTAADFQGSLNKIISRLETDPRAVYRIEDTAFRHELTTDLAVDMYHQYTSGDWSFRLMAPVHGWNTGTYQSATEQFLDAGYTYLGISGLTTQDDSTIEQTTTAVNTIITQHQDTHTERIDVHLFDFDSTDLFTSIASTSTASFDSASMLRSAWTGGDNYHYQDTRYDAIRVHYPSPTDTLSTAISKSLASQTLQHALTAFDTNTAPSTRITAWLANAARTLDVLETYLVNHRHDTKYDSTNLRDIEATFHEHFPHSDSLTATFSPTFSRHLIKKLRADSSATPIGFSDYTSLIMQASNALASFTPPLERVREQERSDSLAVETIMPVLKWYTTRFGDSDRQPTYRELLEQRPWDDCSCRICSELGIDVVIHRGADRNYRRGFHNTHQFYQSFTDALPKVAIGVALPDQQFTAASGSTISSILQSQTPTFWRELFDVPVAELGAFSSTGFHEWWDTATANALPTQSHSVLSDRYDRVYIYFPSSECENSPEGYIHTSCSVCVYTDPMSLYVDASEYLSETLPTEEATPLPFSKIH